jgi:hypothetical protein
MPPSWTGKAAICQRKSRRMHKGPRGENRPAVRNRQRRPRHAVSRMLRSIILALVFASAVFTPARADYTGNQAKAFCGVSKGDPQMLICLGYVTGAVGIIDAFQRANLIPQGVCIPARSTPEQFIAIYNKYLNGNPERLHRDGASLLIEALGKAFPCP